MSRRWVLWTAGVGLAAVLAFLLLDPILATFGVVMVVTALAVGIAASDWDRHSTYEERETVRARKRGEKWDRNKSARDRDRVRWEAYLARKARQAAATPPEQ